MAVQASAEAAELKSAGPRYPKAQGPAASQSFEHLMKPAPRPTPPSPPPKAPMTAAVAAAGSSAPAAAAPPPTAPDTAAAATQPATDSASASATASATDSATDSSRDSKNPQTPAAPETAAPPGGKPLTRLAITMASLRQAQRPATSPASVEDALPLPGELPVVAALTKPADETAAVDPVLPVTGSPTATPEQFLNWLDALKNLAAPRPASASGDDAPTLTSAPRAVFASDVLTTPTLTTVAPADALGAAAVATAAPAAAFALPPPTPLQLPVTTVATAPAGAPLAMDHSDWPQQLGGEIQWRLGVGIQEARIEISPRELGAVDVRLSMDDQGLRVHLSAAHASTRELLQAELPRLRETLQQGGLLVADAQVGRETPGQGSQRDGTPRGRGDGSARGETDSGDGLATLAPRPVSRRRGLLDDYA